MKLLYWFLMFLSIISLAFWAMWSNYAMKYAAYTLIIVGFIATFTFLYLLKWKIRLKKGWC